MYDWQVQNAAEDTTKHKTNNSYFTTYNISRKEANCMLHLFSLTVSTLHLADATICFE